MTPEQIHQLRRMVCNPTIVSDGTLRAAIANFMGWQIDAIYYSDRGKPWASGYHVDRYNDLVRAWTEQVSDLLPRIGLRALEGLPDEVRRELEP